MLSVVTSSKRSRIRHITITRILGFYLANPIHTYTVSILKNIIAMLLLIFSKLYLKKAGRLQIPYYIV